ILNRSCLKNVAISYLIDGSFGGNLNYILEDIEQIEPGRTVFLELFLLNGSSQRRWKDTPVRGVFTRVEPKEFRTNIIKQDRETYSELDLFLNRLIPFLEQLAEKEVRLLIVPML